MTWRALILTVAGALSSASSRAAAQTPPNYGFDWVTVGAAGNRPASQQEAPDLFPPNVSPAIIAGAVNQDYRITRTEVTVGQWFEFVNAYWPYASVAPNNPYLTGPWIGVTNTTPGQNPGYYIAPGGANKPMQTSWQMAARFMNWLNNGKSAQASSFISGAYDTSTFTQNPDHTWNDQLTHSPGAQFWMPTLDEWTKAMYYAPNGNGPGQDRYFRYPTSSDTAPVPGWPWEGGQTSAGLELFSGPDLDVGSYPGVVSPWGLLDGSGSASEWTELMAPDLRSRIVKGSSQFQPLPEYYDRVDYLSGGFPSSSLVGFRIVSAVPNPAGICVILLNSWALLRRRRV
jgi:formylglycine-generating enzyme required for sulfatase activity